MLEFQRLRLSHATLNRDLHIVLGSICGFHDAKQDGIRIHTNVYCTGQTIFPVSETVEEIEKAIEQLTKGKNNGSETNKSI